MPFDSRLVHPDDAPLLPDGEIALPDDLAALAGQLSDDAAHLAGRYPGNPAPQAAIATELARSAAQIKLTSRRRQSLVLRIALVGAGLASIAALALTISLSRRTNEIVPAIAENVGAPSATSLPLNQISPETQYRRLLPYRSQATLSVGELSGPELEALLDLLDEEPKPVASISF
jgi:hypothetical protein